MDTDEPGIFRRLQRGEVASRRRIGGCGDEQCATRLWRQAAKRAPHGALDALGSGQVVRKGLAPDAFCFGEQRATSSRASGFPPVASARWRATFAAIVGAEPLAKKLHRRRHLQRPQLDRRKRDAEVHAFAFAHGKQERERLGREPPRREGERFGRRTVEPVCVVDDNEQRDSLGRHAEEAERTRVDGEPIRRRDRLERERGADGARLRLWNLGEMNEQRSEERLQARERELGLGFDRRVVQHLEAARLLHGVIEKYRLADPGAAAEHEGAAPAETRLP